MKRPPQLPIIIGYGFGCGFLSGCPEAARALPAATACVAAHALALALAGGIVAGFCSLNIIIATQWAT